MAYTSGHRSNAWAAFLAGAMVVLALGLAWLGWSSARDASRLALDLPAAQIPDMPQAPNLPEMPKMPAIPAPGPR